MRRWLLAMALAAAVHGAELAALCGDAGASAEASSGTDPET